MKVFKSFLIFITGLILYTLTKEIWPGGFLLHMVIPLGMIWLTWRVWQKKPEASG